MIEFGMSGRAIPAFVVMDMAYVQHNKINEKKLYTMMFAAFSLNVAVPLAIRWWKPRLLHSQTP